MVINSLYFNEMVTTKIDSFKIDIGQCLENVDSMWVSAKRIFLRLAEKWIEVTNSSLKCRSHFAQIIL